MIEVEQSTAKRVVQDVEKIHLSLPIMLDIKRQLISTASYSMHAKRLTGKDISAIHQGLRASEIAVIKRGEDRAFGIERLMKLCDGLEVHMRFITVPSADAFFHRDLRVQALFKELEKTATACDAALDEIGERSYPLARVQTEMTALLCLKSIEAIARQPYFWAAEAYLLSATLFSTEELLKRVNNKTFKVQRALQLLKATAEFLEDIADDLKQELDNVPNR